MAKIDESLTFHPLNIAVLTVSDTRSVADDTSGALLVARAKTAGHNLIAHEIVKDDIDAIQTKVKEWIAREDIDVILTTGGTGFAPRDVTPEAIKPLLDREMDGFSVVFHMVSMKSVGLSTLQSRACAGQAGDSFIFCVPGSTGACRDAWDGVFAFELDSRYRPCSLVGQIPRFRGMSA